MKRTFAGIPENYASIESADIVLQSIPYDGTSTWGKGADKGFSAFLDAAENMELFDIETQSEVYRRGIHIAEDLSESSSPEKVFDAVYTRCMELLDLNKFLTFFGGEHSVSIGIIKAFYEKYSNFSVLHIDAHADLRPEYMGSKYNHACALHDASRNTHVVQVGIRSMDESEMEFIDEDTCFYAHEMLDEPNWIENAVRALKDNVYITFDLDALDPSIMPATGTPEPGGLLWYETLEFLKAVFMNRNVLGFDLVEFAPIPGMLAPQFLVAKLYYKMLSYKFEI